MHPTRQSVTLVVDSNKHSERGAELAYAKFTASLRSLFYMRSLVLHEAIELDWVVCRPFQADESLAMTIMMYFWDAENYH